MGDPEYQKKYGMETVESKIINIHGSLAEEEEVYETQELVVATNSTPRDQWVRTRAFCWMAALVYFDKVLQIPITIVHEVCSINYRELLEFFMEGDLTGFPVLGMVRDFFRAEAKKIQDGGPEYVQSKEWLNIWWPADEYILIKLTTGGQLDAFYTEAERALARFLESKFASLPPALLHESVLLNRSLLKTPFLKTDLDIEASFNIIEFYQSVLRGQPVLLENESVNYHIDRTSKAWGTWDDWCREVIWYGNKKGAYLYGLSSSPAELAGHY
jgi:hypothetical protein